MTWPDYCIEVAMVNIKHYTYVLSVLASFGFLCIEKSAASALPQFACDYHIKRLEKEQGIPAQLLLAIAKVESGHFDKEKGQMIAWPWTINVQGKGYKFPTKQEAVKAIKGYLAQGIKSIDVGCMQVNLAYHGDEFDSIEQAIDPKNNVEYAAQFLRNLRNEHTSWTKAVAHYHSATPAHHIPYRQKVFEMWFKERRHTQGEGSGYGSLVYGVPTMATFRTLRFKGLKNKGATRPRIIRLNKRSSLPQYRRGQIHQMTQLSSGISKASPSSARSAAHLRPVMMSRYFRAKPGVRSFRKTTGMGQPRTIHFKKP